MNDPPDSLCSRPGACGGPPDGARAGDPSSQPRPFEQLIQDAVRREVLPRDLPRGIAMAPIIALDRLDGRDAIVEVTDGEEALADRQVAGEARVLVDHRPSRRQVGGGAVAEPARLEHDVL